MSTRTKKNWLGQDSLGARMTGVSPSIVARDIETAEKAWDAGRRAHVYLPAAIVGLDTDGLDEALDGMLRIGWKLHSTGIGMQTAGPNRQQAMFVFTRPDASPA